MSQKTHAIRRFGYTEGATEIKSAGSKVADLPGGCLNHHWTKNIIASPDGKRLYATVGSNSNAGENGIDKEDGRAAIWQLDLTSGKSRIFATGLRNPNGMAWTEDGSLWTVVNERDELGSDLVPDYLTAVKDGGFYGWPYSYWGQHVDARVTPQRPDLVAKAVVPETMPWATTLQRSASPLPAEHCCRSGSGTALSLASTGPGTASHAVATKWYSCRFPAASPAARRLMF